MAGKRARSQRPALLVPLRECESIREGENTLALRIVGTNPRAVEKYMAGVDYLLLE